MITLLGMIVRIVWYERTLYRQMLHILSDLDQLIRLFRIIFSRCILVDEIKRRKQRFVCVKYDENSLIF